MVRLDEILHEKLLKGQCREIFDFEVFEFPIWVRIMLSFSQFQFDISQKSLRDHS